MYRNLTNEGPPRKVAKEMSIGPCGTPLRRDLRRNYEDSMNKISRILINGQSIEKASAYGNGGRLHCINLQENVF